MIRSSTLALTQTVVLAMVTVVVTVATISVRPALAQGPAEVLIVDDRIETPLASPGDARRGRTVAFERESACILCHQLAADEPGPLLAGGGNLGPPLLATGLRWTPAQLRLRLVDSSRLNPQTIMPAYYRLPVQRDVAPAYAGRTILTAQQIEDLVAWLSSLK